MDPLKPVSLDVTANDATPVSGPGRTASGAAPALVVANTAAILEVGTVLAGRFEILQMLGIGGMGAVYKAHDRDIERIIVLKCIRPDLAAHPEIIQRFKQEMLLARQISHKNVIRIFDVRESGGLKFITMEYVVGKDLGNMLAERQKLPPSEALEIIQQVCAGLAAAHAEGVLHRDLKPSNIMRDEQGRVVVMDFGLARTVTGDGMTGSGVMLGTMEYMSPEQAKAEAFDARSDLYAVGLIFYELLTGKMPFAAGSAMASLVKRTQERATPVAEIDPEVPASLSAIVSKCLEREPAARYQSCAEVLSDLANIEGGSAAHSLRFPSLGSLGQTVRWSRISVMVAVLLLAGAGYFLRDKLAHPPSPQAPAKVDASLAILLFRNASSDPSLDWLGGSLADMLSTDVGQSSRVRTVSQDRLRQVLADLHLSSDATLDPAILRRLAEFSNADTLVWG